MLLATLVIEREPLRWEDVPPALLLWLQSAGAMASLALFVFFLIAGRGSLKRMFRGQGQPASTTTVRLGIAYTVASWLGYIVLGVFFIARGLGVRAVHPLIPGAYPDRPSPGDYLFAAAGACALLVVIGPIFLALFRDARLGRIWAIGRLCIKEQVRNRGVAVFGALAIILLFIDWFVPYKAEDQVRNYVRVLYTAIWLLFLIVAAVLGSFSLPTDIKTLTIHTVVTKPITKFEVVLGRFLGYGTLLTVMLAIIAGVSLIYIWRGVTEEARKASLTARVATYGQLGFYGTKGDSVGREWDYRKYIGGSHMSGPGNKQYAFWTFDDLSDVRARAGNKSRIEFTFDIFRLTKGTENKGVFCTFLFTDGNLDVPKAERLAEEVRREVNQRLEAEAKKAGPGFDRYSRRPQIEAELAKTHGLFEFAGAEVTDYETQSIDVPYELIEKLREARPPAAVQNEESGRQAAMKVLVSIDRDRGSAAQMLGMAKHDLYILAAENSFYVNYLKGLVALWLSVLLALGIAVALSTYLSGVITLLVTLFLLLSGSFTPDIVQLAENRNFGGGPFEAATRIVTRMPITAPLDDSPAVSLVRGVDELFRWWLRRFLNVLPDITRYDLHTFVGNGFDISWLNMLLTDNLVPLLGYLVPWGILAFYLIRYREIANPM